MACGHLIQHSISGDGVCAGHDLVLFSTADCSAPAIPSNASVLGNVSSTTENAIVTFQCEEGLIPSHPIIITCTRNGQWRPDPAGVQCVPNIAEGKVIVALAHLYGMILVYTASNGQELQRYRDITSTG